MPVKKIDFDRVSEILMETLESGSKIDKEMDKAFKENKTKEVDLDFINAEVLNRNSLARTAIALVTTTRAANNRLK